ncbi:MAG: hypothetical protein ACE5H3_07130, partial [Planctomycetota bacterium]
MSETPEKKYWRSPLDAVVEGPPILPLEDLSGSRRSFLRLAGFGLAAAATAGCSRGPVQKAIPYLVPPEEIVPGRAYWLATTCAGCPAACGMLAKGRDGRPVKLEGNPEHPVSHGGLCAVGQASLLSLYDSHRLDGPRKNGQSLSWKEADASMRALLKDSRTVRILTGTIHGPSTLAAIGRFLKGFPDGKHVMYDPLSVSAILDAHKRTHGVRVLPRYRFDSAEVIAAFGADFLGTWISPVEFSRAYARGRDPDGNPPRMSRHWHFEARMSLTGSRADRRIQLSPWDTPAAVSALCALLEKKKGVSSLLSGDGIDGPLAGELRRLADELWEHRGKALMVCGSNDVAVQVLVNHANDLLGNYGTTLDLERPSRQRQGDDAALAGLRSELAAGKVDALIIQGVNPGFDLPDPERFAESLRKTRLVVSCSAMEDETSSLAGLVCPEPHFLESWNDGEPLQGTFTLTQPSIPPLRKARTLRASLEVWAGGDREDLQIIRDHWEETIYPEMGAEDPFSLFFDRALQAGFIQRRPEVDSRLPGFQASAVKPVAGGPDARQGEFALVLYPKVGIHDGRHAHNPWLQELPDPVTKTVWDNYACFSVETARALGIRQGDVVRLVSEDGKTSLELPAFLQPGQHDRVVAVALGYGRMGTDRFAKIGPQWWEGKDTLEAGSSVGRNAAPFLHWENDTLRFEG